MNYLEQIKEAVSYIKRISDFRPTSGLILGTGQGAFLEDFDVEASIDYKDIPHFPISTVVSHSGQLIFAKYKNRQVLILSGRFHFYEGYSMKEVTFPVRVMQQLGVRQILMASACGSCNANIKTGDLVFVEDHINLQVSNPLIGKNFEELGERFPDMANAYNTEMIEYAEQIARNGNIKAHRGVYIAVTGPFLETRAEFRFFNRIGGDIVGMSTVPEVLAARHANMKVFVVGVVSNEGYIEEGNLPKMTVEEIILEAKAAAPKAMKVIKSLIANFE